MTNLNLSNSEKKISDNELKSIERKLGIELPLDFVLFYKKIMVGNLIKQYSKNIMRPVSVLT